MTDLLDQAALTPGVYDDISFEDYLAIEAFSASAAKTLLTSFPARLKYESDDTEAMSIGRLNHAILLEGRDLSELRFIVPDDFRYIKWKTRDRSKSEWATLSQELDDSGLEPIRRLAAEELMDMQDVIANDPDFKMAFSNGKPEVTLIWREPDFGFLCKARCDWFPNNGHIIPDAKFVASVDRDALGRHIVNYGLHHRSAHYQEGAQIAAGLISPVYMPAFIEKKPPYFRTIRPVDQMVVDLASLELRRAKSIYGYCLEQNHWPGPEADNFNKELEVPHWETKRLEYQYRSEQAEDFQNPDVKEHAA